MSIIIITTLVCSINITAVVFFIYLMLKSTSLTCHCCGSKTKSPFALKQDDELFILCPKCIKVHNSLCPAMQDIGNELALS